MRKSLREFNPDNIAELDLHMWQAYYGHNFLRLFFLLVALVQEQFGLNYLRAVQAAFYAASAAVDFRKNKGNENRERILKKLTRFSALVSRYALEQYDYEKVAELELDWWFVDRYPEKYPSGAREKGLGLAMSAIYNVEPSKLDMYARYRAEAMVLQDEAEKQGVTVDWKNVDILLHQSYKSLHEAVKG